MSIAGPTYTQDNKIFLTWTYGWRDQPRYINSWKLIGGRALPLTPLGFISRTARPEPVIKIIHTRDVWSWQQRVKHKQAIKQCSGENHNDGSPLMDEFSSSESVGTQLARQHVLCSFATCWVLILNHSPHLLGPTSAVHIIQPTKRH